MISPYEERHELYKEAADKIVINDSDMESVIKKIKEIIVSYGREVRV